MADAPNPFVLKALRKKRSSLALEVADLRRHLNYRVKALEHVDGVLRMLDPAIDPTKIPPRLRHKPVMIFRAGERSRVIMTVLRKAGRPMALGAVVEALIKDGGMPDDSGRALEKRARDGLCYLTREGRITKIGAGKAAKWATKQFDTILCESLSR